MLNRLVKSLDYQLKPRQLNAHSEEQLKCLFLILIGISVAVTYPDVCRMRPLQHPANVRTVGIVAL